jgi:hypothetical protein
MVHDGGPVQSQALRRREGGEVVKQLEVKHERHTRCDFVAAGEMREAAACVAEASEVMAA